MNAIEGLAERNRLRALNSHEILDTEAEPEFDRLTRLASLIQDNSDASFSHSICPECRNELYPELRRVKDL